MIVGQHYLCVTDDRTYKILKVEKTLTIECLDCISKQPFMMDKQDFQNLIYRGTFKLTVDSVFVEKPKAAPKQSTLQVDSKPLPEYKPKPKSTNLFGD